MSKKKIIFATATYSLAETQRMTQIAREVRNNGVFDVVFVHYTPKESEISFANMIYEEGFEEALLKPYVTKEVADYIFQVDRGEKTGDLLPFNVLQKRVVSELDFLSKTENIAAVVTGFCLSFYYSCRILDIPVVSVYSGSIHWWLSRNPDECRMPDMFTNPVLDLLGKRFKFKILKWFSYKYKGMFKNGNRLLKSYGKKGFDNIMEFLGGDYYFMSDIPEYIPMENLPDKTFYTGALIGRMNGEIPKEVEMAKQHSQKNGFPLVYFAMGSSGRPEFIKQCLEIFKDQPFTVISPMKKMLDKIEFDGKNGVPDNVFLCDWLPADKVNPMCDVALIHGGQGTVYTAIYSGTPFCSIGNGNIEQEFNAEAGEVLGFAKLYRRNKVKPGDLLKGLTILSNDKTAYEKIQKMGDLIKRPEWNGEKLAAKKLEDLFGT